MALQMRFKLLALLMVWALSHATVFGEPGDQPVKELSPAEKIRKALEQPLTIDYTSRSLPEMVQHLKEKSRIHFILDRLALQQAGLLTIEEDRPGTWPIVNLKGDRYGKLRISVQRMLNNYGLTYVVLQDCVLITTEELGLLRQMRQHVSVNLTNATLSAALKDLARVNALNLVLDPRLSSEADAKVTLQLDDATLETAIRLMAEIGNLKAVRMGNVIFVTDPGRAEKLRSEIASGT